MIADGINWGFPGVIPGPGDFDGDGAYDMGVYDPVTGDWHIRALNGDIIASPQNWGWPEADPVK